MLFVELEPTVIEGEACGAAVRFDVQSCVAVWSAAAATSGGRDQFAGPMVEARRRCLKRCRLAMGESGGNSVKFFGGWALVWGGVSCQLLSWSVVGRSKGGD